MSKKPQQILQEYLHFYSSAQRASRETRLRLWKALQERRAQEFSALEHEIIKESLKTLAQNGVSVTITHDEEQYKRDLQHGSASGSVYLLCDPKFNLLDITPLLPFVSTEQRMHYERAQEELGSS